MKKNRILLTLAAMTALLCACQSAEKNENTSTLTGTVGSADITLTESDPVVTPSYILKCSYFGSTIVTRKMKLFY